ncbi:MAG TPA: hypothetical protein VFK96_06920 [Gammaproteobacteria bacterium]|nr:hypothetical protein [Gammaproteobacteria bacterium]
MNQTDKNGHSRWAVATRRNRLKALKSIFVHIPEALQLKGGTRLSTIVPKFSWYGASRAATPTAVVSSGVLADIYNACMSEITTTMDFVAEGKRLIGENKARIPTKPLQQGDYKDLGVCLAALDQEFAGVIPDRWGIRRVNNHLHNAILAYHGFSEVPNYFYPQPRLLVPFVLLFALYTSANGDMLLDMKHSDFSIESGLGQERLVWRGYKSRAARRQRRSFPMDDSDDNPATLLSFLKQWTRRLRAEASSQITDYVFLFVPRWGGGKHVGSFRATKDSRNISIWTQNLRRFLIDHDLDRVTLRILRASGLDLVHDLFDGDIRAIKAAGGQRRDATIYSHYTSDSARQRNAERTAATLQLYDRWRETDGRNDSRRTGSQEDYGSCTPGWRCLDPFSSPILGQKHGKLCTAYGACPVCPLAHIDVGSAYALARLLQLRVAIEHAQSILPAERWLYVWAPRLGALNQTWIPRFSSVVMDDAAKLDLPPLAGLE